MEVNTRVRALEVLIQDKGVPGVVEMVPALPLAAGVLRPPGDGLWRSDRGHRGAGPTGGRAGAGPAPAGGAAVLLRSRAGARSRGRGGAPRASSNGGGGSPARGAHVHLYFIGFTPGLPYMTGMPERLHLPRLSSPRTKVPPGSVGLGGIQCCSTRSRAPGGTGSRAQPLRLYDPDGPEPVLLRAGDRVRFRPIDRAEFDAIAAVAARTYRPRIGERRGARSSRWWNRGRRPRSRTSGVPATSAPASRRRAPWTACVHPRQPTGRQCRRGRCPRVHGGGPALRGGNRRAISVTGADMPVTVNGREAPSWAAIRVRAGDAVRVGAARAGVRGLHRLRRRHRRSAGTGLALDVSPGSSRRARRTGPAPRRRATPVPRRLARPRPRLSALHLRGGAHAPRRAGAAGGSLHRRGIAALLGHAYALLPQSDRMGARLARARIAHGGPRHHLRRHRAREHPGAG